MYQLFLRTRDIFIASKEDLGRGNNFTHNIKVKSKLPIYRKQFKIPEDGSFRFVPDYRALNEQGQDNRYNMKDIGERISKIGKGSYGIYEFFFFQLLKK